jgi:hypothetical protein
MDDKIKIDYVEPFYTFNEEYQDLFKYVYEEDISEFRLYLYESRDHWQEQAAFSIKELYEKWEHDESWQNDKQVSEEWVKIWTMS